MFAGCSLTERKGWECKVKEKVESTVELALDPTGKLFNEQSEMKSEDPEQTQLGIAELAPAEASVEPAPIVPKGDSDDIAIIFMFWQKTMHSMHSKLDSSRTRDIRRGLKLGFSRDEICQAILGCYLTPHNMGKNDRGQKYNSLNVILRDADHIERFMANATSPPKPAEKTSSGGAWFLSDTVALAKATEVGVGPALPGESEKTWHARIRAAIDNGGQPVAVAATPSAAVVPELKADVTPEQKAARRAALLAVAPGLKFGKTEQHAPTPGSAVPHAPTAQSSEHIRAMGCSNEQRIGNERVRNA